MNIKKKFPKLFEIQRIKTKVLFILMDSLRITIYYFINEKKSMHSFIIKIQNCIEILKFPFTKGEKCNKNNQMISFNEAD